MLRDYIRAALLIAQTTRRDQENVVHVTNHTLVERGEQLSKILIFLYTATVLKTPLRMILSEFRNAD